MKHSAPAHKGGKKGYPMKEKGPPPAMPDSHKRMSEAEHKKAMEKMHKGKKP